MTMIEDPKALRKAQKKKERTEAEKREKQERARARRLAQKRDKTLTAAYGGYKPVEQWDEEELARGRPRDKNGFFTGSAPKWITREVHEEAVRRFKDIATSEMRGLVPTALRTVEQVMTSTDTDENGKPLVPAGVRLEAAKWTIEHLVGKPTQRTEMDISVKLQGILAQVMVQPGEIPGELMPAIDVDEWDPDEGPGVGDA